MRSKELIELLLESSSLREDLLKEAGGVIKDIMNNINLTDELIARVSDKTFAFIKSWKED